MIYSVAHPCAPLCAVSNAGKFTLMLMPWGVMFLVSLRAAALATSDQYSRPAFSPCVSICQPPEQEHSCPSASHACVCSKHYSFRTGLTLFQASRRLFCWPGPGGVAVFDRFFSLPIKTSGAHAPGLAPPPLCFLGLLHHLDHHHAGCLVPVALRQRCGRPARATLLLAGCPRSFGIHSAHTGTGSSVSKQFCYCRAFPKLGSSGGGPERGGRCDHADVCFSLRLLVSARSADRLAGEPHSREDMRVKKRLILLFGVWANCSASAFVAGSFGQT
jgi:hypothetical protein